MRNAVIRAASLAAAAVVAFATCAAPAGADGSPAMWLVQGPKAKVYIFGTIHLMKPGVAWTTPAIDAALAQSGTLRLEVPDDLSNPSAILPQIQSLGMDPAHPLSTKISKADLDKLDALIKSSGGMGEAQIEPFRPWFAAIMVTALPAMKAGYSSSGGIDVTLRAKMTAAGKPVTGFETLDQQLHFFSDLTQAQEVTMLHSALVSSADGTAPIDKLVSSWQNGDVAYVAKIEAPSGGLDPSIIDVLLTQRNARWAKQLDDILHGDGTTFVAVGMAHLAGPGSLLDDLTKLGYTVTRVE